MTEPMFSSPPLTGVRVVELAGLAPGPFAGLLCADFGASVLRIDRATADTHSHTLPPATADLLTRGKKSIAVDLKSSRGRDFVKRLVAFVDVLIDPFRPGVLEKLGLGPDRLREINPRLIVARMTGFRRDGKYKDMAGHDINYIAVSGVLSMLGRAEEKPYAPGNILGDFAGGGAVCFQGILLALLHRTRTGLGQVVEANMVDGAAFLATMPRLALGNKTWHDSRGKNVLDGGCPYYDTYETRDGKYMAVGALEPHFFGAFIRGLGVSSADIPGNREDKATWSKQKELYAAKFCQRTRAEWEKIFDGTDACCTPVLSQEELREGGYEHRAVVTLATSPGHPYSHQEAWCANGLEPSKGGETLLSEWTEWKRDQHYSIEKGGIVLLPKTARGNL